MSNSNCTYLAGRIISDNDVWNWSKSSSDTPQLEELLTGLRKGAVLLKHGRAGRPKIHYFKLIDADSSLSWRSSSGSLRCVDLHTVTEVIPGQATEVFRRWPLKVGTVSFSLCYDDGGQVRTLDLTCLDQSQYLLWYDGLRLVASVLKDHSSSVAMLRFPQSAEPAPQRVPCDTLCWGGAGVGGGGGGALGRAWPPATSASTPKRQGSSLYWETFPIPVMIRSNEKLDVVAIAVGQKHASMATACGALYTYGRGRGGCLGLGHEGDQPYPQRVASLAGQFITSLACSDDVSAAITDGGHLYMWGKVFHPCHSASQQRTSAPATQLTRTLPTLIKFPQDILIRQVSTGPFHCAAVSRGGSLFVWGEGFGGKLGLGDQSDRCIPTLIPQLHNVREVACGIYHTACITADEMYTWGGVNGCIVFGGADSGRKRDSNRGCLGLGPDFMYKGALIPHKVSLALEENDQELLAVAAGSHLTVVLTSGGSVFQSGTTTATVGGRPDWEDAMEPTVIKGMLSSYSVRAIACGMHHVVALGTHIEKKSCALLAWGLSTGNRAHPESSMPVLVDSFNMGKTRVVIRAISAGGVNSMVVCDHDMKKYEPDGGRDMLEETSKALLSKLATRTGGNANSNGASILAVGSITVGGAHGQATSLTRPSVSSSLSKGRSGGSFFSASVAEGARQSFPRVISIAGSSADSLPAPSRTSISFSRHQSLDRLESEAESASSVLQQQYATAFLPPGREDSVSSRLNKLSLKGNHSNALNHLQSSCSTPESREQPSLSSAMSQKQLLIQTEQQRLEEWAKELAWKEAELSMREDALENSKKSVSQAAPFQSSVCVKEWSEEIEPGVTAVFTGGSGEGSPDGGKRLRRIRFSCTKYTKESAAAWYEANQHRLAQVSTSPAPLPVLVRHHQRQTSSNNFSFDARELASFFDKEALLRNN